jgi:hypothetical protein
LPRLLIQPAPQLRAKVAGLSPVSPPSLGRSLLLGISSEAVHRLDKLRKNGGLQEG